MAKVCGTCPVCGEYTDLTFEHIPPAAAFNNDPVRALSGQQWVDNMTGATWRGRVQQRGVGRVATCGRCNNVTGGWYGGEYVRWARWAADMLVRYRSPESLDNSPARHHIVAPLMGVRPLLFLKQVVYMFVVVNGTGFGDVNEVLRRFVLSREATDFPSRFHVHLALYWGPQGRLVGGSAKLDLARGVSAYLSEVALFPFACALRIGERLPDLPPCEISWFSRFGADEEVDLELNLLIGFGHTQIECDYRSQAALNQQLAADSQSAS